MGDAMSESHKHHLAEQAKAAPSSYLAGQRAFAAEAERIARETPFIGELFAAHRREHGKRIADAIAAAAAAAKLGDGSGTSKIKPGQHAAALLESLRDANRAKDAETALAAERAAREKAERERDEAVRALQVFAAIIPSSLYPSDGHDGEPYAVVLKDSYGNKAEFTGKDLARARWVLDSIRGAALGKPDAREDG